MPVFRRKRVSFCQQADFGRDEDIVFDGDSPEVEKNAVEVDEDVLPDCSVPPVVYVKRGKDRAAFIDQRSRDPAEQVAHLLRIGGLIQLQKQFSRVERHVSKFGVFGIVERNSLAVPKSREYVSRWFHVVEKGSGHASEQAR